jgi:tetratricopeptide (TPR) repeat protein
VAEFEKGLATEPQHTGLMTFLAETLYHKGDIERAMQLLSDALAFNPNVQSTRMFMAMCLSQTGQPDKAKELLDENVIAFAEADGDGAYWLGALYALLGEKDDAVKWLHHAIQVGYENYPWFIVDHNLDSLRQDPQFHQMMEDLGARWERLRQEAHAT